VEASSGRIAGEGEDRVRLDEGGRKSTWKGEQWIPVQEKEGE
jgi:hypothetical protein